MPGPDVAFGVISDIDDTILETGVQRAWEMLRQTFTGSALTRTPFRGAAELYRDLASPANPVFYVSSSPWNLHAFVVAFLRHRGFPLGPVLLRDLLGTRAGREQKGGRITEVLDLHPDLRFVLIGDSGEQDPEVYAEVVRTHPGRVLAVYIREVRLDLDDGRVERVHGRLARRRAVRGRRRQRRGARARRPAGTALVHRGPRGFEIGRRGQDTWSAGSEGGRPTDRPGHPHPNCRCGRSAVSGYGRGRTSKQDAPVPTCRTVHHPPESSAHGAVRGRQTRT